MSNSNASLNYVATLEKVRQSVQPILDRSSEIMLQVGREAPGTLSQYMTEIVSRKGKRMRASFVGLISYSGTQEPLERAALSASAIEMLHLATLIHDDIIDDSDIRRNESSAHKKWGTRVAVLVGDYALSKALELIIDDEDRRIPSSISRAASRLVAGEVLEIDYSGKFNLTLNQYLEVIYGKTASLWESCGECGAVLAGYDPEMVHGWASVGKELGLAFQIVDDLLDFGIGAQNLGKGTKNDLHNGLTTLPLIYFFQEAAESKISQMQEYLSSPLMDTEIPKIVELLQEEGCFQMAKDFAQQKINQSISFMSNLPKSENTENLIELCELMGSRSA